MFGSKQRRLDRQQQRINNLVQQLDDSRKLQATFQGNTARIAQRFAAEHDGGITLRARLDRALRACAGYRAEIAAQHRVVDVLGDQLISAMGYTDAERRLLAEVRVSRDVTA